MVNKKTIYRERSSGRFVKKSKWDNDTKNRYVRERVPVKKKEKPPPPTPPPPETEVFEYIVSFTYDKTGRSFDVIVTATSEAEANSVAREFLKGDKNANKITRSGFSGWATRTAQGEASDEESGEAEYRDESEEN